MIQEYKSGLLRLPMAHGRLYKEMKGFAAENIKKTPTNKNDIVSIYSMQII
jgi:hypothetical protein